MRHLAFVLAIFIASIASAQAQYYQRRAYPVEDDCPQGRQIRAQKAYPATMTDCEVLDADTSQENRRLASQQQGQLPTTRPVRTYNPSFDCTKAVGIVEHLICTDEKLSELDRTLAEAYQKALDNQVDKSWLAAQERQFVAERNNCGRQKPSDIRPCVQQLVGARAMYLSTFWKQDLSPVAPAPITAPAVKPIDVAIAAQSANQNGIVSTNYDDNVSKPALQTNTHISPVVVLILIGLFLYFLPSLIAVNRGHHNTLAISALNLFLGWSFLGWVLAFVWACTRVERTRIDSRDVLVTRQGPQF